MFGGYGIWILKIMLGLSVQYHEIVTTVKVCV